MSLLALLLIISEARFEDYDRAVIRNLKLNSGETMYMSFRIDSFKPQAKTNVVRLSYSLDCFDPQGKPVVETHTGKIEQALSPQDEKWRPKVNWSVDVPDHAPGGAYKVAILVRDEIAGSEARHEMPFTVQGEAVSESAELGIAAFEFADAEEGSPKDPPVFAPGKPLWARFRLVGFRPSPENKISIEQDLTVVDSEGKVLFSKPRAFVEEQQSQYPPRFLPASFNLELEPKLKPGEYTVRIDIRDRITQKTAQFETKFSVVR